MPCDTECITLAGSGSHCDDAVSGVAVTCCTEIVKTKTIEPVEVHYLRLHLIHIGRIGCRKHCDVEIIRLWCRLCCSIIPSSTASEKNISSTVIGDRLDSHLTHAKSFNERAVSNIECINVIYIANENVIPCNCHAEIGRA